MLPCSRVDSIAAILAESMATLSAAGVESAQAESETVVAHVLNISRGELQTRALLGKNVDQTSVKQVEAIIRRRSFREPLQHILGVAPFRQLELFVGEGVFIPRPETELLVEHALNFLRNLDVAAPKVVDFGTGSGAIALSIALECPSAHVVAVEKSEEAYRWAAKNFAETGLHNATLVRGEILDALSDENGTFDAIVTNPPYIPLGMIPRDIEVRKFDPEMALFSGEDGLNAVRELAIRATALLKPEGLIIIEHGELQGEQIAHILTRGGLINAETLQDLTGRDRYTRAFQPAET